ACHSEEINIKAPPVVKQMFKITAKCIFHRGEMRWIVRNAQSYASPLYVLQSDTMPCAVALSSGVLCFLSAKSTLKYGEFIWRREWIGKWCK
ncbi:hypothetical protein ACV35V_34970, partial [Pseudomonas aeruginosa]